jgi:hypothetical protein
MEEDKEVADYVRLKMTCRKEPLYEQDPVICGQANYKHLKLLQNDGHFQTLVQGYLHDKSSVHDVTKTKSF